MHPPRLHALAFALAAFAVSLSGSASAGSTPPVRKPGAPLELSITPLGDLRPGEVGEIAVVATALTESSDLSLDVEVPRELALYSGDLHQRGPVRANTRFRLHLMVRVPTEGNPVITATARLKAGEAGAFTTTAVYRIGGEASTAPFKEGGVPKLRAGEWVREYPLP